MQVRVVADNPEQRSDNIKIYTLQVAHLLAVRISPPRPPAPLARCQNRNLATSHCCCFVGRRHLCICVACVRSPL